MDELVGPGLMVLASKDVLDKMLGPTAEYIGGEIQGFVEKCNVNVDSIFIKAKNKLGERIESPGTVSPRVLKSVLDEGRFCDDEVAAEYYGGVLASSRVEGGRDDRGVSHMELIKRMSVYQLRLHYLFYYLLKLHGEVGSEIATYSGRMKNKIFIPFSVYATAMEFHKGEDFNSIFSHSVSGLVTFGLVSDDYQYGPQSEIISVHKDCPPEGGLILTPSVMGAELFLWAEGVNHFEPSQIFSSQFKKPSPIIPIPAGSARLSVV